MAVAERDRGVCAQCGTGLGTDTTLCPYCGGDPGSTVTGVYPLRQLSAIERVVLTMLYVEDRGPRWWDRPGRVIAFSVAAAVLLLWSAAA